jgi:TATA-box binding protein (TBP) (component of TFIID and TFIIIB)
MDFELSKTMDFEMATSMAMASKAFGDMLLLPVYIVTMTMCFKTTFSSINVEVLLSDFLEAASLCDAKITNLKQFKNCIIFKISEGVSNISAKIFTNGTIHMTGVKCYKDAFNVTKRIISVLDLFLGDGNDIVIKSHATQMMNTCFKLRNHFHLANAFVAMQAKITGDQMVYYDKQIHAAVKIKQSLKSPSVLLFRTGSVIVAGCKNHNDVLVTAKLFKDLLEASNFESYTFDA